jgi:predicted protein tyrosine phosphatase
MMQVIVLSEQEFRACDLRANDLIISIVSPGREHPRPHETGLARLDLKFQDTMWDIPDAHFVDGITDEQAESIAKFARYWTSQAERLIVHCEAGMSRSAGVAIGIARYLLDDEEENRLRDQKPHFNLYVAQKIWGAFRRMREN